MPSSWLQPRTERTLRLMAAWAECLFFSVRHVVSCVWNTLSVLFFFLLGSWRVFQIVLVPREHCACVSHMSNLSPSMLCRGYSVQGWALPSLVHRKLSGCHWSVQFQLCSCWLAAVSWIPPSNKLPACDLVHIEAEVPCWPEIFPRMSPLFLHFLHKLIFHSLTKDN